ncbi:hypothetical protein BGZ50_000463, partial [Haplosporangium sp. Z 11]
KADGYDEYEAVYNSISSDEIVRVLPDLDREVNAWLNQRVHYRDDGMSSMRKQKELEEEEEEEPLIRRRHRRYLNKEEEKDEEKEEEKEMEEVVEEEEEEEEEVVVEEEEVVVEEEPLVRRRHKRPLDEEEPLSRCKRQRQYSEKFSIAPTALSAALTASREVDDAVDHIASVQIDNPPSQSSDYTNWALDSGY